MVGVSRNTIRFIEAGQFNPTAKPVLILFLALNKKFEELFDVLGGYDGIDTGTLMMGISLVLGFVASLWSEELIAYIILIGVVVGLGFILYGQFKYNGGFF